MSLKVCGMATGSYPFRRRRVTQSVVLSLVFATAMATPATASTLVEPPMSDEPVLITVTDLDLGAEAFDRLVEFSNGGHSQLGAIVAEAHGYFGGGETVGVGFGVGSGGNGYRPNITISLWRSDVDVSTALSAIKSAIGVPLSPTTSKGDCAIACDGSGVSPTIASSAPSTTVPDAPEQSPVAQEEQPAPQPEQTTETPLVATGVVSGAYQVTKPVAKKPAPKRVKKARRATTMAVRVTSR